MLPLGMASNTSQPFFSPLRHFLLLLLLVMISLSSSALSRGALACCIQEHHDSLLLFKSSLKFISSDNAWYFFPGSFTYRFPNESKLASWKPDTDCCRWDGVTCGKRKSAPCYVTALNLSHSDLSGNIHPALFNLTSLRSLDLSGNYFANVSLPSSGFENLVKLNTLDLLDCGFVGILPVGISRLTNLVHLDLSFNDFGGNFSDAISPLTNLVFLGLGGLSPYKWEKSTTIIVPDLVFLARNLCRLQVLSLRQCGLSGPIPESIAHLKQLTQLDLSGNQLSGNIPLESIAHLKQLTQLDLSGNQLSGNISLESIAHLKQLTQLDLSSNQLSGNISLSIANLTQLDLLDLTGNRISGSLPIFSPSASITNIWLDANMLTGSIPLLYGQLPNLTCLLLSNNSLTGLIPMSLFSHPTLEILDLAENKLVGLHHEFPNTTSVLKIVDLSDNPLQGSFPHIFFTLHHLESLQINRNNFTGVMDICSFKSLRNLSELELSNNLLTIDSDECEFFLPKFKLLSLRSCNMTKIPKLLQNQDELYKLNLSWNRIEGYIPYWLWNYSHQSYATLDLSHNLLVSSKETILDISKSQYDHVFLQSNRLEGPMPLPPPNSTSIDYSDNGLIGSIPMNIGSYIMDAVYLSLSKNKLLGEIPPSICDATYLQILDLSHNKLSGPLPSCISNMLQLTHLNLRGNVLSGMIPNEFTRNCALEVLNVNGNMFQDRVPRKLSSCTALKVFDIGNNKIVDVFPFWLGMLPNLKVLILKNNKFYDSLPKKWNGTFSDLQILDISQNQFFGSLPTNMFMNLNAMKIQHDSEKATFLLSNWTSEAYYKDPITLSEKGKEMELTWNLVIYNSFDISSNSFQGHIPDEIGELIFLKSLNLSNNNLTGYIPSSLGRLTQLESMDLSRNMISGKIPFELLFLRYLEVLNLSYNQLEGEIPQGSQFNTFTMFSYIGNKHLCGLPTSQNCHKKDHMNVSQSFYRFSKELNWRIVSIEIGFMSGIAFWFMFLFFSTKARAQLNLLVCKMQEKILSFSLSWKA